MIDDRIEMSTVSYIADHEFHSYLPGDFVHITTETNDTLIGQVFQAPERFVSRVSSGGQVKQISHVVKVLMLDNISYPRLQYCVTSQLSPITHVVS